jgi:hypothetical protein
MANKKIVKKVEVKKEEVIKISPLETKATPVEAKKVEVTKEEIIEPQNKSRRMARKYSEAE